MFDMWRRAGFAAGCVFFLHLSPPGEREYEIAPPTIHAQRDALAEHFAIAMQIHGEQLAGRRMRKMGIKYSRFHPAGGEVKREFIAVHSLRDWSNVLAKWYAVEGPGVGDLVLRLAPPAAAILGHERGVREGALRVLVERLVV